MDLLLKRVLWRDFVSSTWRFRLSGRDDPLYDEAYGPKGPRLPQWKRRVLGIWDDPTWLRACVDEAYMASEDRGATRYGWRHPHPDWVSLREAARMMGLTYQQLYVALQNGRVKFLVVHAKGKRIHRRQVEAYLKGEPLPDVSGELDAPGGPLH
jgi:hypothetical protein